jgi:hypothetical protein
MLVPIFHTDHLQRPRKQCGCFAQTHIVTLAACVHTARRYLESSRKLIIKNKIMKQTVTERSILEACVVIFISVSML